MRPPPVSVLLPVYNAATTVERAIRSLLDGTWDDFELVVVDDGSSDESAAVVAGIADDRVRLHRRPHTGVAGAANFGITQCTGRFVARMDADDWSHPGRLATQVAELQTGNVDIVGGRVRIVDGDGHAVASWQRYERWINDHLSTAEITALRFIESPLANPTVMARREVFELGHRDGDFPEDYELWLRALGAGFRAVKVPEIVLDWTDGPGRLTRNDARYSPAAFDRCRRGHLLNGPLKGVEQVDLWGGGQTGKPWLRWLQAAGFQVRRVIEVAPAKIGQLLHGVPVIAPDDLPAADGTPMLVAVGAEGAREKIVPHVLHKGHVVGGDVWFVA